MNINEINAILRTVFEAALEEGSNYPVRITLRSGLNFRLLLIENLQDSILGLTDEQSYDSIKELECFEATYVRKESIVDIFCPSIE